MQKSAEIIFFSLMMVLMLAGGIYLSNAANPSKLNEFEGFYDFLEQYQTTDDKEGLISDYLIWQDEKGFPAIENDTHAVFIYYSPYSRSSVSVAGDFTGWSPVSLKKLSGVSFFYLGMEFENDARLDYKLIVDGSWVLDSRNDNTVPGGFGDNSELAMPGFSQPVEIIYQKDIDHGSLETIETDLTYNPNIKVYTPSGYKSSSDKRYPTAYFADGTEYISFAKAVNIIDNLIAEKRLDPIIAVFADPYPSTSQRHTWYNCSDFAYIDFMEELVEFIDTNYQTNTSATSRLHLGDSLGGQISAHVGLQLPELFKNIGVHSGAFWDGPAMSGTVTIGCFVKDKFKDADANLNLKMWFSAGSYESEIYDDTKTVVSYIEEKGWKYDAMYLNEGHSWGQWRHTLDNLLEFFFPYTEPAPAGPESSDTSLSPYIFSPILVPITAIFKKKRKSKK